MGTKFLREWVRTLRLIKPSVILTAEDQRRLAEETAKQVAA